MRIVARMTKDEAKQIIAAVARSATGYAEGEAMAWATGVVDAMTLHRVGYFMSLDEPTVRTFAEQLAALE